jgi:serine protease inhibitor
MESPASTTTLKMATSLFSALLAPKENANSLVSPLSIQLALALALEGAAEETAAQLRRAIGYPSGTDQAEVHKDMVSLAASVRPLPQVTLKQA